MNKTSIRIIKSVFLSAVMSLIHASAKGNSVDIEKRLEDSCTVATLKNDNKNYIDGFKKVGEKVCMINSDYEQVIQSILDI